MYGARSKDKNSSPVDSPINPPEASEWGAGRGNAHTPASPGLIITHRSCPEQEASLRPSFVFCSLSFFPPLFLAAIAPSFSRSSLPLLVVSHILLRTPYRYHPLNIRTYAYEYQTQICKVFSFLCTVLYTGLFASPADVFQCRLYSVLRCEPTLRHLPNSEVVFACLRVCVQVTSIVQWRETKREGTTRLRVPLWFISQLYAENIANITTYQKAHHRTLPLELPVGWYTPSSSWPRSAVQRPPRDSSSHPPTLCGTHRRTLRPSPHRSSKNTLSNPKWHEGTASIGYRDQVAYDCLQSSDHIAWKRSRNKTRCSVKTV